MPVIVSSGLLPVFNPMQMVFTRKMMHPDKLLQLKALCDAGIGYRRISKQLDVNINTCKSACRTYKLTKNLPPKVKRYKGTIQGRKQLEIQQYINDHKEFTRKDLIRDLQLHVSPQTITNYFKYRHLGRYNVKPKLIQTNSKKHILVDDQGSDDSDYIE
ncbi:hypothetical protein BC833DRAFT_564013 [Globomyces pollinis-pini]|nr:hypothetical protein BC833DRAFT_564013 [Globomyces pollinis-pini]